MHEKGGAGIRCPIYRVEDKFQPQRSKYYNEPTKKYASMGTMKLIRLVSHSQLSHTTPPYGGGVMWR